MIEVIPVPAFQDNYIWLIHNSTQSSVAIVDPGDANPVITTLKKLKLTPVAILITHHHADHTGGIHKLRDSYDIPIYGPINETIPEITFPLKDGDNIEITELGAEFEILDVPGHTLGHIAYYGHDRVFIGDTLFLSGCGRLFEGTAEEMYNSLEKIKALPGKTQIYCGHEYTLDNLRFAKLLEPTNLHITKKIELSKKARNKNLPTVPGTLNVEKNTNPFLRVQEPCVIAAAEKKIGHKLSNSIDVFSAIRQWKDTF